MFTNFIRGFLGLIGVIKPSKKIDTSHNAEFKRSIDTCAIVLTTKIGYPLGQAIGAATGSYWAHSQLYVGQTWGNLIRKLVPAFLLNPKIPKEALLNEVVEAQGDGVKVSQLSLDEENTMVAFQRKLSFVETVKILTRIYLNVGKPYGYLDFISNAFPDLKIDDKDPGFICSALTSDAWLPVERIAKPGVEIWKINPGQQNDYLEPNLKFQKLTWNW